MRLAVILSGAIAAGSVNAAERSTVPLSDVVSVCVMDEAIGTSGTSTDARVLAKAAVTKCRTFVDQLADSSKPLGVTQADHRAAVYTGWVNKTAANITKIRNSN